MPTRVQNDLPAPLAEYADYFDIHFSFAFQPIVHAERRAAVAYEALVRSVAGDSAERIITRIHPENRFQFDQACRIKAVQVAARMGLESGLQLNCTADSSEEVAAIAEITRQAAKHFGFPRERVVLEFGESGRLNTPDQYAGIRTITRFFGFKVAADDFGAAGTALGMLADFRPDQVKLHRNVVNGIHRSRTQQAMFKGIEGACATLGVDIIATSVDSASDFNWLRDNGVELYQGAYFAEPGFESVPDGLRELRAS